MNFEFATAQRIVFGPGKIVDAGKIAATFGARALIVTGDIGRAAPLIAALDAAGVPHTAFVTHGEPTIELAQHGAQRARECSAGLVIGFGGGSSIDAGKAIAALAANPGEPLDYLEVIGRGKALDVAPLPYIAVPTTSGSGAEATRNAVLASPAHGVKVSLRSPLMLPRVALVDPSLTLGLPRAVTAATGMDALAQLIEPFVTPRATPVTDALCREGMQRAARSLPTACDQPGNAAAREDMSLASLLGGIALANSGLGAVHGFAAPIGGRFPAPHGAVCAQLLPLVWDANIAALSDRAPGHPALARYAEAARLLTGDPSASAADGARWLFELRANLGIPVFASYGMRAGDVAELAQNAAIASSMQANPIKLTESELTAILHAAL
jgi:alcohol dehydrogenase class IV